MKSILTLVAAMAIANRMWKRAFGVAVREPVTDLDDPSAASNPPLLQHLTAEMVRVKFDLKQFMRLVFNTQAYQREATSYDFEAGKPYMFPGPTLRRMTAEQAWDSCATLAVGPAVDRFKSERADKYAKAMRIDFGASNVEEQLRNAFQAMREAGGPGGKAGKGHGAIARRPEVGLRELEARARIGGLSGDPVHGVGH